MSTDTPTPEVPREPSAFHPSIHFGQQTTDAGTDRKRHLDGEIIDGCIERGDRRKRTDSIYWLRETFDAVTYRLVVNIDDNEVITGYPIGIDPNAAKQLGSRWTDDQVEDILHFIRTDPRTETDQ
ncbi:MULTISPECIES: hypothetical protein [Halorussus]|uniref:hypothetical protein n=1 Tax=Halorussus TaxID=1070314 RepID=UPI00209E3DF3|nr:hypothetical protein [Halorussus vallis]USZ75647.1 hypothetical protein NGM07_19740 [Halorussus vallis]USZ75701.1 hypothetical protein NGM07_20015 [Halorussus vallis]